MNKFYITISAITLLAFGVSNAEPAKALVNNLNFHAEFIPKYTDKLAELVRDTNKRVDEGERTLVHITSPGGYIFTLNEIMTVLDNSEVPIDTYISRYAYSCGAMMFLAGENRIMKEGSIIMFHYASVYGYTSNDLYRILGQHNVSFYETIMAFMFFGGPEGVRYLAESLAEDDKKLKQALVDKIGMDAANKVFRQGYDTYLNAREALAAGIATRVVQ